MGACARVTLISMTVSASFGLTGCAAINDLKVGISRWLDTVNFTGEGEVLPGNAPEAAAPVIAPERIPKGAAKAPEKKIKAAARKLQRPQTVVLPKKPPISDSPETARPGETDAQSAPPASMRLRTPFPEAPPPGIFSR
jgi:hypothetical protein